MKRLSRRRFGFLRARLEVLAALVVLLFGGEHVLPALHHVFVAHEMCAEHGQLEHVGTGGEKRSHRDEGPTFEGISGDAEHHEHCDSVPASPPRAPLALANDAVFTPACGLRSPTLVVSAAVPPADVIAFAPKQSPPA